MSLAIGAGTQRAFEPAPTTEFIMKKILSALVAVAFVAVSAPAFAEEPAAAAAAPAAAAATTETKTVKTEKKVTKKA